MKKFHDGALDIYMKFRGEMQDSVDRILDEHLPSMAPTWENAYVGYSVRKNALYVALTEEEEFIQYLPWSKFVASTLDTDPDVRRAFIPKLEDLVRKLQKSLVGVEDE